MRDLNGSNKTLMGHATDHNINKPVTLALTIGE